MGTSGTRRGAAVLAFAAALAGCATAPAPAPAPAPIAVATPAPAPLLARDENFAVVIVQSGDTLASLAKRYLGDAERGWWIAQFNDIDAVRAGQVVTIPLRQRNPLGVHVNGVQTVPILCYHRFGSKASKLSVTAAAFEAQMNYLAQHGYTVLPLQRLSRFLEGREALPAKSVVITIDDGYRSTFEIAYPILRKFGFPATVFLYSDFVGAPDAMTWAQMEEITASGSIEIQPHSKSHANLTLRLPGESEARYRERIRREVDAPIAMLRQRLADGSFAFAYPYGDVNDYVVELLVRQKLSQGVTVTPGGNPFYAYPYMLRRSMVFGNEDLDAFAAKLVTFVRIASQ
ncbi:MAG: polysaccharide deacetylase family protein [Burkholderiales bacterium]|nr:polysaccharide deacetylase family protein [Burkholderiales bacterium]